MPTIDEIQAEKERRKKSGVASEIAAEKERRKNAVDSSYTGPVDPETGEPMFPAGGPSTFQQFGRSESSSLGRIGGAVSDPFRDTQFGIPKEFSDKFQAESGPLTVFNTFNDLLINGTASPAFAGLQALGAGAEGAIDGMAQVIIESGGDAQRTKRGARDIKGLLEVLPATITPMATGRVSSSVKQRAPLPRHPQDALSSEQMQIATDAKSLPFPVPLTKGDITQNPKVQAFESEALKNARGERSFAVMKQARDQQDEAIRKNIAEFQKDMTGSKVASVQEQTGLGAERTSNYLKQLAAEDKKAINNAYESARKLDASINGGLLQAYSISTKNHLIKQGYDLEEMPRLTKRLQEFEQFTKDGEFTRATVSEIELLRKRINKNIKTVQRTDPTEAGALIEMKKRLDDFVGDMIDHDLVYGNTEAINAWKNARMLRYEYSNKFDSNKIVKSIVSDDLSQEEIINKLYGTSSMGFKTESGSAVEQIKGIVGKDSDAFKALKDEAILRLLKNQSRDQNGYFSGVKFKNALDDAMIKNPTLMKSLFTTEEIHELKKFALVSERVTKKADGAINYSNSAITSMRDKAGRKIVRKVPIVGDFLELMLEIHDDMTNVSAIERNLMYEQAVLSLASDPYIVSSSLKTHSIPSAATAVGIALPNAEKSPYGAHGLPN